MRLPLLCKAAPPHLRSTSKVRLALPMYALIGSRHSFARLERCVGTLLPESCVSQTKGSRAGRAHGRDEQRQVEALHASHNLADDTSRGDGPGQIIKRGAHRR